MNELADYRSKIGTFLPSMGKISNSNSHQKSHGYGSAGICIALAIFIAITMALEMDPGVESNPEPGLIDTITTEEKTTFNKVQRLNHRIASAASHRYFLSVCITRNLLPKGYKSKTPIVTSSPNQSLADHKCELTKEYTIKLMKADVYHYDNILPSLVIERDLA